MNKKETEFYNNLIHQYFNYNVDIFNRQIYLGSLDDNNGEESGTDYRMCESLVKGLTFLDNLNNDPIIIYMNNLGGDWYHGMFIFDTIRSVNSHVTIIGGGYICSMGSIILQSADTRIITPNSVIMIHDGTEEINTDCKSFENWATQTKYCRKRMYQIYYERMKLKNRLITIKKIENLCSHDKIYNPQEAIEIGLADWILENISDIKTWFATDENASKFEFNF